MLAVLVFVVGAASTSDAIIAPAAIAHHVDVLASDAFEGRKPGTPGEEKAVRYIADQFAALGLTPGNNGSWFQDVPLVEVTAGSDRQLRLDDAADRPDGTGRRFVSHNVIGVFPGASRPQEYLLYLAHWDHLGRCKADATGDDLCNGAVDNASGVGGLIELARAFARGPRPARSILFLATTAEEEGLLGGTWFARHPTVPLRRIVGGFGLDTIAIRGRGADILVLGHSLSDMDAFIARAAHAQHRRVVNRREAQAFFTRSDHYALVKAGVPVLIATGLFGKNRDAAGLSDKATVAFFEARYHRAGDEPGPHIRFDGAAQDVELLYDIGRDLGNSYRWPAWKAGTPFRAARQRQPR